MQAKLGLCVLILVVFSVEGQTQKAKDKNGDTISLKKYYSRDELTEVFGSHDKYQQVIATYLMFAIPVRRQTPREVGSTRFTLPGGNIHTTTPNLCFMRSGMPQVHPRRSAFILL